MYHACLQKKVVYDHLEEGFKLNKRYHNGVEDVHNYMYTLYGLSYYFSSTSTFNATIKRKIVSEICSTPDCAYSQEEV